MIDPTLDHVGIVVLDLDAAIDAMRVQLGFEFTVVFDDVLPVHEESSGDRGVHLRIAYTAQHPALVMLTSVYHNLLRAWATP